MDKVITMKKTLIKLIILFSIFYILISCNDPIFFIVHEETPILKPIIDGSPTNFVILGDNMYVASGNKIFIYRKNTNKWSEWKTLDGRIGGLAATNSSLYALYLNNKDSGNGTIRNCDLDTDLSLSNVQSIHASEDVLFACVRNNDNEYRIHFREGNSDLKIIPVMSFDSILKGVASNIKYYYLCTYEGIYYIEKSQINDPSTLPDDLPVIGKGNDFTGIIALKNDYVAAITNDGKLYQIDNTIPRKAAEFSDERYSSGALALWYRENDEMPSLLLVGRKELYYSTSSNYTNGYVEITLDTSAPIDETTGERNPLSGRISGTSFRDPGKSTPSSIDNYDRYVSSLGKKPVNFIIQAPLAIDSKRTLFASTQQNGVWSYKDRGDGELWNAER